MKVSERELYKVTFLFTNPLKKESYYKNITSYAEAHPKVDICDDLPSPPEREQETAYVAVLPNPKRQGNEFKMAVDMALKKIIGEDYDEWAPFVTNVEALNTVFIEEEEVKNE